MQRAVLTSCMWIVLINAAYAGNNPEVVNHPADIEPGESSILGGDQSPMRGCSVDVLEFALDIGSECVQPGEVVTVILSQHDLQQLVRGYQVFAEFDDSRLTHSANTFLTCPGTCPSDLRTPYGAPILNSVTGGDIDLAAGIDDSQGQSATQDDAPLVELEFVALAVEGGTTIEFRASDPPTRFSDFFGQNVTPCLVASPSIVIDGTDPVITCPADLAVECDESTDPSNTGEATATDTLDASPLIEYSDDEDLDDCSGTGAITRTWTATDCAGNSTSCEQIITVQDTTEPVITCPDDAIVECDELTAPGAGAWSVQNIVDDDDEPFGRGQGPSDGEPRNVRGMALSPDGNYLYLGYNQHKQLRKIDLSVTDPADSCAVVAELYFATLLAPEQAAYTGTYMPDSVDNPKAVATDDVGRVYATRTTEIQVFDADLTTKLLTITGAGPSASIGVNGIHVERKGPGEVYVYAAVRGLISGQARVYRMVVLESAMTGGSVTLASVLDATFDGDGIVVLGLDSAGNASDDLRGLASDVDGNVWVAENDGTLFQVIPAAGDGASTILKRVLAGAFDVAIDGDRVLVASDSQTVTVVDRNDISVILDTLDPFSPPLGLNIEKLAEVGTSTGIDLIPGGPIFLAIEGGSSTPVGFFNSSFSDVNCDGPDPNDHIDDDNDPILRFEAGLGEATATDNCDSAPTISHSDADVPGACPQEKTIVRTWQAEDACGNIATCEQTITVQDTTPPTGTAGTIDSCYASAALAEAAAIAATTDLADNCSSNGDLEVTASTVGDCAATVTVTVTDECGNSTDFDYFTRIDDEAPVLSCPPNPLGGLIISEIMDGTWPNGLPKFVELANCSSDPVDLSGFSLGNINNGAVTMGFDALVLSGILAPGEVHVISYEDGDSPFNSTFFDVFGFNADELAPGAFINGNDVLALFAGAALAGDPADGNGAPVLDVYGVVGVDGIGQVWEYTDGYSYRQPFIAAGNAGTFLAIEWFFGGADSLETGNDVTELAAMLANTTPGAHQCGGGVIVVSNDAGQCDAEVTLPETATDNCDGPVPVTYEADFGSGFEPITNPYTFPVGTWPVIGTAVDSCGLVGTCEFSVSVVDDEPPTGTQGTIDDCYPGNASAEAAAIAATTDLADNCTSNGDLLVTASTDGDCDAVVTVTVADEAGNSVMFDYMTTVDGTPPALTCPNFIGDGGLIISELMDGTLPNGEPKFIEITNCTDSAVDLSNYRVALFANANIGENPASMDYGDMSAILAAGESFIIANSNAGPADTFLDVYGYEADVYHTVPNGNGNDVYQLMQNDGGGGDIVVDAYGVVGVDGSGQPWDYLDSYAYSLPDRSANGGAFNPANWFIAGANALDFATTDGIAAVTSPGSHSCSSVLTVKADAGGCDAVVVYPSATATDNCDPAPVVECTPPSGSVFAEGSTQVTCTATDECGNVASCGFEVVVESVNELAITVELQPNIDTGITPPDTLTRCITFELWDCPDSAPAFTVSTEIVFDVTHPGGFGDPNLAVGSAVIDVPCGSYMCITARDELHTLRRTDESFGVSGTQYLADFTGDPDSGGDWLIGGNLNDDEYIDILDFGVFSSQFGNTLSNDTTCATPFPHSDISGDGDVDNLDFSFILNNFLDEHEANCCGAPLRMADGSDGQPGPVTNISVRELRRLGLGRLSRGDLNRDGWLNLDDITAFLDGVRPVGVSPETAPQPAEAGASQLQPSALSD